MTQIVSSKALKQTITIERILGQYTTHTPGPHFLVFAGLHGNEPSGVFALQNVFRKLKEDHIPFKGRITGIAGNLPALGAGVRYIDEDLNRVFLPGNMQEAKKPHLYHTELRELKALTELVDELTAEAAEVFFIDCHSTSSQSVPFISINAGYPQTYQFVKGIPVPVVAGTEREIRGCLSEYYNKRGFHGFTFEGGQHDGLDTIYNQEAMIWQSLVHAGCITENVAHVAVAETTLTNDTTEPHKFFSVVSSYSIEEGEVFEMEPGFTNLRPIKKGQLLAHSNGEPLYAPGDGRILMPLYQQQGNFGYFFAREIDEWHLLRDEVETTH